MSGTTPTVDAFRTKVRLLRAVQKTVGVIAINNYIADMTALLRSSGFFTNQEIGFGFQINGNIAETIGGSAGINTNGSNITGDISLSLIGIELGGRVTIETNSSSPITAQGVTNIPLELPGVAGLFLQKTPELISKYPVLAQAMGAASQLPLQVKGNVAILNTNGDGGIDLAELTIQVGLGKNFGDVAEGGAGIIYSYTIKFESKARKISNWTTKINQYIDANSSLQAGALASDRTSAINRISASLNSYVGSNVEAYAATLVYKEAGLTGEFSFNDFDSIILENSKEGVEPHSIKVSSVVVNGQVQYAIDQRYAYIYGGTKNADGDYVNIVYDDPETTINESLSGGGYQDTAVVSNTLVLDSNGAVVLSSTETGFIANSMTGEGRPVYFFGGKPTAMSDHLYSLNTFRKNASGRYKDYLAGFRVIAPGVAIKKVGGTTTIKTNDDGYDGEVIVVTAPRRSEAVSVQILKEGEAPINVNPGFDASKLLEDFVRHIERLDTKGIAGNVSTGESDGGGGQTATSASSFLKRNAQGELVISVPVSGGGTVEHVVKQNSVTGKFDPVKIRTIKDGFEVTTTFDPNTGTKSNSYRFQERPVSFAK